MIISLLNQKGGVGKTTLSVNLAGYFSEKGKKVVLIDADEQESALNWAVIRENEANFLVTGMAKPILHREVKKYKTDYDIVIIDGTPRKDEVTKSAIAGSDIVLIPILPSYYDVIAAEVIVKFTKDLIEQYQDHKLIRAFFVINRKIWNATINKDTFETLQSYNIPILESHIGQRQKFVDATKNGRTIQEELVNCKEKDRIAAIEIENLGQEIEKLMGVYNG